MIFNQLRNSARLWMPSLLPIIDAAVVIKFPIDPHKALPTRMTAWRLMTSGQFRLPYRITAVEDLASVVIIADKHDDQQGLDDERIFVECVPAGSNADESHYNDEKQVAEQLAAMCATLPTSTCIITIGHFSSAVQREHGYLVDGAVSHALVCTHDTLLVPPWAFDDMTDEEKSQTASSSLRNSMTCVEELMYIETLPGFSGWPDLSNQAILAVNSEGRIETQ
jgi:hypothetical protein